MWREGASDLWGLVRRDEGERELEHLDALPSRLEAVLTGEEGDREREASLEAV